MDCLYPRDLLQSAKKKRGIDRFFPKCFWRAHDFDQLDGRIVSILLFFQVWKRHAAILCDGTNPKNRGEKLICRCDHFPVSEAATGDRMEATSPARELAKIAASFFATRFTNLV